MFVPKSTTPPVIWKTVGTGRGSWVPLLEKHTKTKQEKGVVRAGCSRSGSSMQTLYPSPLPTCCSESGSDTWDMLTILLQCEPPGQLGERQEMEK